MDNIHLQHIRWTNVNSIFRAIASKPKISRAEIAETTGLSLMTVGKTADIFCDVGIAVQAKESKTTVGRRAGYLRLNPDNCVIILDISKHDFSISIINMSMHTVVTANYQYNDDFFFAENFEIYLKNAAEFIFNQPASKNYIAVGVVVPGYYDAESDRVLCDHADVYRTVTIRGSIIKYFPFLSVHILPLDRATAIAHKDQYDSDGTQMLVHWYMDDQAVNGTIFMQGQIIDGMHHTSGDFGQIPIAKGRTLSTALKAVTTVEEAAYETAKILAGVLHVIDPHILILDTPLFPAEFAFNELIVHILRRDFNFNEKTLPQIISICPSAPHHAYLGLMLVIREHWLKEIMNETR